MCQIKLKKNELPGDDFLNDSIYISYFLSMISFPYSIPVEYNYNLIFIDSTYCQGQYTLDLQEMYFYYYFYNKNIFILHRFYVTFHNDLGDHISDLCHIQATPR